MLNSLFKYYGIRNFSQSKIWRNIEKVKPNQPEPTSYSTGSLKIDCNPSEFDKKILVWSGKFKSKEDIPDRISYGLLEDAKSKVRIKGGSWMMVFTLIMCGYYIWKGKRDTHAGQNINKIFMEKYGKEGKN